MPADDNVFRMNARRFETVGDLGRWLLTHENDFKAAVVIVDNEDGAIYCFNVPTDLKVSERLGLLEAGKAIITHDANWVDLAEG